MGITKLDHVYVETRDWDAATAFWGGLGFSFVEQWGSDGHRAGRLEAGSAAVVLAEVDEDAAPAFNVFFQLDDAERFAPGDRVDVIHSLEPTHWGTRWVRVRDPEGRVHCLEAQPGE